MEAGMRVAPEEYGIRRTAARHQRGMRSFSEPGDQVVNSSLEHMGTIAAACLTLAAGVVWAQTGGPAGNSTGTGTGTGTGSGTSNGNGNPKDSPGSPGTSPSTTLGSGSNTGPGTSGSMNNSTGTGSTGSDGQMRPARSDRN
jgi:hypothetical protein